MVVPEEKESRSSRRVDQAFESPPARTARGSLGLLLLPREMAALCRERRYKGRLGS
jgi:hypothetical protein